MIVCGSQQVIKSHFIGVVLNGGLALFNHFRVVVVLPFFHNELQPGGCIIGCYAQYLAPYRGNGVLRHLLELHIGRQELQGCGTGLFLGKHLVKHIEHLGAVAASLFILAYKLSDDRGLGVVGRVGVEEYRGHLPAVERVLLLHLVVIEQRQLCQHVVLVFFYHVVEHLQRFFPSFVVEQPVAHHYLVIGVVRMFLYKRVQFVVGSLLVALPIVHLHFLQRDLLTSSLFRFHTFQCAEHHGVVLFLFVELYQNVEYLVTIVIVLVKLLVGLDSIIVFTFLDIELGKSLSVCVVFRREFARPGIVV